ncbi:MAG: helix-turn-helix domain-containing protein [Phycisphaerales bacterium]
MPDSARRTHICRADEIERLRQEKGLSLERLAAKAGVTVRTLKRWLSGKPAFFDNIAAIGTALDVPPKTLMRGQDNTGPPVLTQRAVFNLQMTISGTIDSAEKARALAELPSSIVADLARIGIHIAASDARLSVETRADELTRTLVCIHGVLDSGKHCWIYAAVRPSMYDTFLRAQAEGTLDIHNFAVWGEIIVSGNEKLPPLAVTTKVADMYGSSAEQMQRMLEAYAAEQADETCSTARQ